MYIGILDDDSQFVEILREKLTQYYREYNCRVFDSIDDRIFNESFDILFLDVMVNNQESFNFGEELSLKNPATILVYISSMDHFVYDSIYQTSFFFVRKSNLDNDLKKFFIKYNHKIFRENQTLEIISNKNKYQVYQKDIIMIVSRKNSVTIITNNQQYVVYKTLTATYELLDKDKFYKLNSYTILNLTHVQTINPKSLIMDNQEEVLFSKNSKKPFMIAYATYKRARLWNGL